MPFLICGLTNRWYAEDGHTYQEKMLMASPEVQGIDLFKIAGRSISGWIPSLKTGTVVRQPFCSQLEERLLMWLEYHPLVANYSRGGIDLQLVTNYRLSSTEQPAFTIGS